VEKGRTFHRRHLDAKTKTEFRKKGVDSDRPYRRWKDAVKIYAKRGREGMGPKEKKWKGLEISKKKRVDILGGNQKRGKKRKRGEAKNVKGNARGSQSMSLCKGRGGKAGGFC